MTLLIHQCYDHPAMGMNQRHKAVPASYLILRRGDEILLLLRKNTGYRDGWYTVPSGHVEEGEFPTDGMIREAKEEIGINLVRSALRHAHTMYRSKQNSPGDRADYFFDVTEWNGEPINAEPEKCECIEWFSIHALPENLMPYERDAIEHIKAGILYSEVDLDR
jgi:8-oxo-dGTP diphosphatase